MSTALMLTGATPESALAASSVQPTYFRTNWAIYCTPTSPFPLRLVAMPDQILSPS